jgi:hypothetical protein
LAAEKMQDKVILATLATYLWPKGNANLRVQGVVLGVLAVLSRV